MAKEFFKNLPDTTTPLNAQRMNSFLNGEEAMGSIVVDDITCKNILPNNIKSQTINGLTVTKNTDGSITLNGTTTEAVYLDIYKDPQGITLKGDYRFYLIGNSTVTNLQGTINGNNTIYLKFVDTAESVAVNYNIDTILTRIFTFISKGTSFDNVTLKYMITKGTSEESYTEHKVFDGTNLKGNYLWVNPNPTEAMAYQYGAITLSSSDYDVLEFYFYTSTDNKVMTVQKVMAGYGAVGMYINGYAGLVYSRAIGYVSKTSYTINECYRYGYGATTPPAGSNTFLIPAYVIGYKNSFNPMSTTTSTASVEETE